METNTYNLINLIVQTIVSFAIVGTFWIYFYQLKAMREGAKGNNIISLINLLQDSKVRESRRIVITQLKNKDFNTWTDGEKDAASRVCSTYDIASQIIFSQKLVPSEPFIDNWGPSIKQCYPILKDFIMDLQKLNGSRYWNDFGILYQNVLKRKI